MRKETGDTYVRRRFDAPRETGRKRGARNYGEGPCGGRGGGGEGGEARLAKPPYPEGARATWETN